MQNNNVSCLREMLMQMPVKQLDELLREELRKDPVDGDKVRLILKLLEERDTDDPVENSPGIEKAWENYQEKVGEPQRKPTGRWSGMLKAASIVLVACLLFTSLTQTAEAESLFARIIRWTDSFFELFAQNNAQATTEYAFETDNPGLQEVYDTITELGVTVPVVPMWIPEGYVLDECKVVEARTKTEVYARFTDGEAEITFRINLYSSNTAITYYKDEVDVEKVELGGTEYSLIRNNDLLYAVWAKDNIEYSIAVDCQEDVLLRILRSIYTMEDE